MLLIPVGSTQQQPEQKAVVGVPWAIQRSDKDPKQLEEVGHDAFTLQSHDLGMQLYINYAATRSKDGRLRVQLVAKMFACEDYGQI